MDAALFDLASQRDQLANLAASAVHSSWCITVGCFWVWFSHSEKSKKERRAFAMYHETPPWKPTTFQQESWSVEWRWLSLWWGLNVKLTEKNLFLFLTKEVQVSDDWGEGKESTGQKSNLRIWEPEQNPEIFLHNYNSPCAEKMLWSDCDLSVASQGVRHRHGICSQIQNGTAVLTIPKETFSKGVQRKQDISKSKSN